MGNTCHLRLLGLVRRRWQKKLRLLLGLVRRAWAKESPGCFQKTKLPLLRLVGRACGQQQQNSQVKLFG